MAKVKKYLCLSRTICQARCISLISVYTSVDTKAVIRWVPPNFKHDQDRDTVSWDRHYVKMKSVVHSTILSPNQSWSSCGSPTAACTCSLGKGKNQFPWLLSFLLPSHSWTWPLYASKMTFGPNCTIASQPFSFGLFLAIKAQIERVCFYSHTLIFFSQVNSYGVYHVFKGSINYAEECAKNDEES